MNCYFKHKVIIITGASSGIGPATAKAFAREGSYISRLPDSWLIK